MRIGTTSHHLMISLALCMTLAACGGKGESGKTQVIARVNGQEITVHQLNQVLGMMGPEAAASPTEASKNALENIINQTVGVQAALKMKLDRDPAIMQAIESAKERVLLDAYLGRALQKTPAPTSPEIHDYFTQHPELFANRSVYVFDQLTAKAGKETLTSLLNKVAGVNHMAEYVAWLKSKGVDYNLSSEAKSSEQLPMAMLAQMQKLKIGDLGYLSATDGVVVIEMEKIIEQPMTEQQAHPLIERYLANMKQMTAAQKLLRDLRANAKVEYLGDFKSDGKPAQAAPAQPAVPDQSTTPPKAGAGYIEKGLKGL
jgi:EpsD family peptidyl-prolyl cis-trans isomerase